jgi:hypothetical protein
VDGTGSGSCPIETLLRAVLKLRPVLQSWLIRKVISGSRP